MTILLISIFAVGYLCIAFEHNLKIDKSVFAILTGMVLWAGLALGHIPIAGNETPEEAINHHTGGIAGIIFFIIGAMAIVNALMERGSFDLFNQWIRTKNQIKLMWLTTIITFFLSAVLDNLTTTIVMIAILRQLIRGKGDLMVFGVLVIIAANAGGAWSPIGDITTTMLWIDQKITTGALIGHVFLPSVVQAAFIPVILTLFPGLLRRLTHGIVELKEEKRTVVKKNHDGKAFMLFFGIAALIFVPIFKTLTHLPPYVGMLFSAGAVLLVNEYFNRRARRKEKETVHMHHLLEKIEWNAVLFFLGILIAVSALESAGILSGAASGLSASMSLETFGTLLGCISAVVDNIPLVFAAMGMFELGQDHWFWHFIAYTAGTGGSILIIGSAAGVVAMSLLKIEFFWYVRKFSLLILLSYLAGAALFLLLR